MRIYKNFPRSTDKLTSELGRMLIGPTGNYWWLIADTPKLQKSWIPDMLKGHIQMLLVLNNSAFDVDTIW